MLRCQTLSGFQFTYDSVFDKNISEEFTDIFSFVVNRDGGLLFDIKSPFSQLDYHGVFINFLCKTST
ncbi:MAG: hypothetical protein A3E57_01570 [Candidatus Muproteobacteria bacterium RIFCSPHIGHO2_12_FULL_60_33]|uniref:Uncharacterized protein n=1 Tax=Candidatus Muproteobacteria bacterium RIFCSPLOWO2_01_FULL_60_18 TaxID=1817768 RepID=A0A1F6TW99_9PROT|nr:MAG: hypothetical protein A3A87_04295 [Candidatus Muproteobacteria bacterium RIFCSPLOWO2_01_FULL_60_18]OGI52335.1 MAG: hypothetical protein A2W42_04990 [Candidatus Muproteobacteria bacterium RIFCSPHIGHO2_01_60_12]OGI53451.1 MAG: hypothetical protein A3E57_01570 [Candidatus Muproteobacteria bacterium RIFCSPHIGHO2_12_FULL_60_33]OGI56049.1 MAG: hypothetical protein A3D32_02645 [Candidatus Muproteobacteria bacterium RIFCSPHIGHO2_02_FULL_60_13]OGI61006.1 MAG: hypothetical protein A2809_00315 [Can